MSWRDEDIRKKLVGVKITSFKLDGDQEGADLEGERDGQPVKFRFTVDADCCSHTWIESVIEESALVGYVVTSVDDLELPDDAPYNRNPDSATQGAAADSECRQYYALAITTTRGKCILDYRNDSNGYYGGSIDVSEVAA